MTLDINHIESHFYSRIGAEYSKGVRLLGQRKILKWIIRRGQEFQSPWIWWGDVNKTREESYGGGAHEGVDLALAEMKGTHRIQAGMEGMRVPSFTDGTIIWNFYDLVGDTVIVATSQSYEDYRMIIQYSHIEFENAKVGDPISQGHDIGKIKLSTNPSSITASHLHLSAAIIKERLLDLPNGKVDFKRWLEWHRARELLYLDPLNLISPDVKESHFVLGEEANSPLSTLVSTGVTKIDRLELRRVLARSFPGIRSISRKTASEAASLVKPDGLLITISDGTWKIENGEKVNVPELTRLTGRGFENLVESISQIESFSQPQDK